VIFDAIDLVQGLPWPDGVDDLIRVVTYYREYRQTIPSGRFEVQVDPTLGREIHVSVPKSEVLEVYEMDRLIRWLVGQITEKDPTWKLENPPR